MPLKVGTAYVDVQARLDAVKNQLRTQLQQSVKNAGADAAKGFGASFKNALKGGGIGDLGRVFAGVAAGAGILGGLAVGIKHVADETAAFADEVDDLQDVTGATAEDASRLKAVLDAVGISASTVGKPLLRLSEAVRTGDEGLKSFFSTSEFSRIQGQDLSRTIFDLADKYKSLNSAQKQNQLLVESFGPRGAAMREVLERSREDLEKYIETAERTGRIFDEKAIEDARRYQVSIRELGSTFEGLRMKVGRAAIPILTNFTNNLNETVIQTEEAADGIGGAIERLPGPIKKAFGFIKNDILGSIPGLGLWVKTSEDASDSTAELTGSLGELEVAALDNEEAAKRLAEAYKRSFEIANQAAADFEKRLAELSPALGEPFKEVKFSISDTFEKDADAIESAQDRVESAQERLADARKELFGEAFDRDKWQPSVGDFTLDELVKDRQEFAKKELEREQEFNRDQLDEMGERADDYRDASEDLKEAQDDLLKAQKGTLTKGFSTVLDENIKNLEGFSDGLEILKTRFQALGSEGLDEAEESFLAGLADLGPGAAELIGNVVDLSDEELGALKDKFAKQIQLAKKAADIEFDKYPKNFAEKMSAARASAVREGQEMIDRFNSLPEGSTLQEAMADEVTGIAQVMESVLGPTLSEAQLDFLETARTADTAADRIEALQRFINSLHGQEIDLVINIDKSQLDAFLAAPIGTAELVLLNQTGVNNPNPNGPGSDRFQHRAAGGSVRAGWPYWVGEEGPEPFVPSTDGTILSKEEAARAVAGADSGGDIHVTLVMPNGDVLAKHTVPYISRAMNQRSRSHR